MQLFSVEKVKVYVYKVNVFIDAETNIFQVYYTVFVKDLIVFFLRNPEENMSDGKKETVSITTFKKWTESSVCFTQILLQSELIFFFEKVFHTFIDVHLPVI